MSLSPACYIFSLLNIFMTFSGLSVRKLDRWPMATAARRVFATVLFISMVAYSLLSLRLWIFDFKITIDKVYSILFTGIYSMATVSYVCLIFWQTDNKLLHHIHLTAEATVQSGCVFYKRCLYSYAAVLSLLIIVAVLILNLQSTLLNFDSVLNFSHISYFTDQKHIFFDVTDLSYLAVFIYFFMTLSFCVSLFVFFVVCLIDKLEFKYLNFQISNEYKLDAKVLEMYFDKHVKLLVAVEQASEMFKLYVLFMFFITIPCIVFSIYSFMLSQSAEERLLIAFGTGVVLCALLLLTILPAELNNEICKTADIVYEKTRSTDLQNSPELFRLVTWFALKTANKPSGISIGGFLTITQNLLITVVTCTVTYLAFVLQSFPYQPVKELTEALLNISTQSNPKRQ